MVDLTENKITIFRSD